MTAKTMIVLIILAKNDQITMRYCLLLQPLAIQLQAYAFQDIEKFQAIIDCSLRCETAFLKTL